MIDKFKRQKLNANCQTHGKSLTCICTDMNCQRARLCCKQCIVLHSHSQKIISIQAFQNRKIQFILNKAKMASKNLLIDLDLIVEKIQEKISKLRTDMIQKLNQKLDQALDPSQDRKFSNCSSASILRKNLFEMQKGQINHLVFLLSNDSLSVPEQMREVWISLQRSFIKAIHSIPQNFQLQKQNNQIPLQTHKQKRPYLRKSLAFDFKIEPSNTLSRMTKDIFRQTNALNNTKDFKPSLSNLRQFGTSISVSSPITHLKQSSTYNRKEPLPKEASVKESRQQQHKRQQKKAIDLLEPRVDLCKPELNIIPPKIQVKFDYKPDQLSSKYKFNNSLSNNDSYREKPFLNKSSESSVSQKVSEVQLGQHQHEQRINTLVYFKCCGKYYQCVICHDQSEKHEYLDENPSVRYCKNCKESFLVECGNSVSIRCYECEEQPQQH